MERAGDSIVILRQNSPISVSHNRFVGTLHEYITNTEQKMVNIFHLLPIRVSGKVHVDTEKLLAYIKLFPDKNVDLYIYAMDQVGVLVEDESHYVYLPHKDNIL